MVETGGRDRKLAACNGLIQRSFAYKVVGKDGHSNRWFGVFSGKTVRTSGGSGFVDNGAVRV